MLKYKLAQPASRTSSNTTGYEQNQLTRANNTLYILDAPCQGIKQSNITTDYQVLESKMFWYVHRLEIKIKRHVKPHRKPT
jgi:hypothetical protein